MGRIFEWANIFGLCKMVKIDTQMVLAKWVSMVVVKANEARNCWKNMELEVVWSIQMTYLILLNLVTLKMKLKLVSVPSEFHAVRSKLKWVQVHF